MATLSDGPLLSLTGREARMLYYAAKIGDLRKHHRLDRGPLYDLLALISRAAFAEDGEVPRQDTASEERRWWTVDQVAKFTRTAPRTIRLHCQNGDLPATKQGPSWVIEATVAKTYIESRRQK